MQRLQRSTIHDNVGISAIRLDCNLPAFVVVCDEDHGLHLGA